ncbi:MAG: HAD family hydrolase [Dongiaceae bacterium]
MPEGLTTVVFDLGNVLVDWNPRHLYRKLIRDEAAMERFLAEVITRDWIIAWDMGRPLADGIAELSARHPHYRAEIAAFHSRWNEMIPSPVDGTVAILEELKAKRTPLYALTNWSAETFPIARTRFPFFDWFDGIVVSGEVKMVKPDAAIYQHLLATHGLRAGDCVFIDDSPVNVAGAEAVGIAGLRFTSPDQLRRDLARLGLLGEMPVVS